MKKIFLLLILVILSCKQQSYKNKTLDFDQVSHFHIQMEDQDLFDMASQDTLAFKQQFKVDILLNNKFEKLSDTLFIKDLLEIGFVKNEISKEKLSRLQSIFTFENEQTKKVNECINIYRDILIFKTNNQITGMAKVCLECEMMHVVNSNKKLLTQLSEYDIEQLKQFK